MKKVTCKEARNSWNNCINQKLPNWESKYGFDRLSPEKQNKWIEDLEKIKIKNNYVNTYK